MGKLKYCRISRLGGAKLTPLIGGGSDHGNSGSSGGDGNGSGDGDG